MTTTIWGSRMSPAATQLLRTLVAWTGCWLHVDYWVEITAANEQGRSAAAGLALGSPANLFSWNWLAHRPNEINRQFVRSLTSVSLGDIVSWAPMIRTCPTPEECDWINIQRLAISHNATYSNRPGASLGVECARVCWHSYSDVVNNTSY